MRPLIDWGKVGEMAGAVTAVAGALAACFVMGKAVLDYLEAREAREAERATDEVVTGDGD